MTNNININIKTYYNIICVSINNDNNKCGNTSCRRHCWSLRFLIVSVILVFPT